MPSLGSWYLERIESADESSWEKENQKVGRFMQSQLKITSQNSKKSQNLMTSRKSDHEVGMDGLPAPPLADAAVRLAYPEHVL